MWAALKAFFSSREAHSVNISFFASWSLLFIVHMSLQIQKAYLKDLKQLISSDCKVCEVWKGNVIISILSV
jgi:hypothetical protein